VKREVARAGIEERPPFKPSVDRGRRAQDLRLPAAHRRRERNAIVGCFHDAADRLGAEAQCLRAAMDLDLLRRQRVDWHPVVLPILGNVHRADAVLLHAHAEISEPT
jgi:hypothetical protein